MKYISLRGMLTLTAIVGLGLAAYFLPARQLVMDLIAEVRDFGLLAPLAFVLAYVVAAIAGFSRTLLNIAAGIVFEPMLAVAVVLLASVMTFICTFFIARYVAHDWVARKMQDVPLAGTLLSAVDEQGFRLLVMMRMNPFVPGAVNGYGFGLTSIKPLPYLLASVLGALPLALIHVYLGWAGGMALLRPDGRSEELRNGTFVFGIVLSLAVLLLVSWYGYRAIKVAESDANENAGRAAR